MRQSIQICLQTISRLRTHQRCRFLLCLLLVACLLTSFVLQILDHVASRRPVVLLLEAAISKKSNNDGMSYESKPCVQQRNNQNVWSQRYLPPVPPMTVTISPLLTAALKLVQSNVDFRKETELMGEKESDAFKPKINRKELQIAGDNCFILPRQQQRCLIVYCTRHTEFWVDHATYCVRCCWWHFSIFFSDSEVSGKI